MGFIIGIVILGVIAIPIIFLFMVGGIAAADSKAKAKTPELLDAAFDGRDQVVYETKVVGPSVKDVIEGADARGYDLTHQVSGSYSTATLTFQKRPTD